MAQHIEDFCEEKARAGDGTFAVAYAILQLVHQQEQVAKKLGNLGFDAPGGGMGATEYIGVQLREIAEALSCLNVSASISGSLDNA